ncbi:MAG: nucleotidyltransferase family protein [Candidatus Obscuribacterales bacterium]|nr:nucleotidyltransferase family protein [Candidatus Obscuribacterales bacterium]
MGNTSGTAIILAGGQGQRLRPLTSDRPKCMVEILGTPIIAFQMHWLRSYGIRHIVIAGGYLHESIVNFLGDGTKWGMRISYSIEEQPLGRGGAFKQALKLVAPQDKVYAFNGDIICNLSLQALGDFHQAQNAIATIVTVPLVSPYGIVEINEEHSVTGFREKPVLPFHVNAGIYVFSPEIIDLLPDKGDHEDTTFPELAKNGRLKAFRASNILWKSIDTMKDVSEIRTELERVLLSAFLQPDSLEII